MRALRTAATGMEAQQLNVEVISNNIANMNTVGFKKQRAEFQDLLYESIVRPGAQSSDAGTVVPTGVQVGSGVKAGQLQLATFLNEGGLEALGSNLFSESGASGAATVGTPGDTGVGKLLQGYTEASNVDAVTEISALIVAQRAYEMNSKVITAADQMLSTASQVKT